MLQTLHSIFSTLPFAVCLFWWAILLVRREQWRLDRGALMLSGFAFACTILYFCHAVFFNGEESSMIRALYRLANLAVYPLFWLYIRTISEPDPLPLKAFWVLLPALAALMLSIVAYSLGEPADYADIPLRDVFLVEVVWVCLAGVHRLTEYDRRVENFYADTERKSLAPMRSLLYLFVLISFLSALANFLGRGLFQNTLLLAVPSLLFSVLLSCIFYTGIRLEYTAAEIASAPAEGRETDEETEEFHQLMERINTLMENRQLFRTPGLKITDLATEMGTNRTYVSNCINRLAGQSFSDYVNAYRVRYAQILMQMNDSGQTLAQIGQQAGFSGETSFFRNFKKVTGQTPMEWLAGRE